METETPVVCLVGDDYPARESMGSLIRAAGFDVQTYRSIQDCFEQPSFAPACMVLAVRRPLSEGPSLLSSDLTRSGSDIPVLFVTSPDDTPTYLRSLRTGATEFLSKPIQDEELLGAIRRLIGREPESTAKRGRREELDAAAQIQQGLMALTLPQPSFATVTGMNLPCSEIGGDFFTALALEDALVVAIADVAGKGIAAAVMASALQGMIHEGLRYNVSLRDIARDANEFLAGRDLGSKYATCIIARLQQNGILKYLNCGHIPPLLLSNSGAVSLPETNLPIGLVPEVEYQSGAIQLNPGDRVILVTDGVTEAENEHGDFFGYERLTSLAKRGLLPQDIFEAVRGFAGDVALNDDCTIIGLEYTGIAPTVS